MMSVQNNVSGVLRARDAAAFLALGKSTFWKWVKEGRLPKGTRLSARATVWKLVDLEDFLQQQTVAQGD